MWDGFIKGLKIFVKCRHRAIYGSMDKMKGESGQPFISASC